MRKVLVIVVVGVASSGSLLLAPVAAGSGSGAQTVTLATLRQGALYPSQGATAVYAGTVRSNLGSGSVIEKIRIAKHPTSTTYTFTGTNTAYYARGTTRSTISGTVTVRANGSLRIAGQGQYRGGTGSYRRVRGKYSFLGTAPRPVPHSRPAPCHLSDGWKVVAEDDEVVVVLKQPDYPIQEYRYCSYLNPNRGFQLLVRNDESTYLGGAATSSVVDGVALSYLLYHSTTYADSPACNGQGAPVQSYATYAVDTSTGRRESLAQGAGNVTAALLAPSGVGAWTVNDVACQSGNQPTRSEALQAFTFKTGAVRDLDTGDPGETRQSPPVLANLALYQCAAGCSSGATAVAWTHDGAQRYAEVG